MASAKSANEAMWFAGKRGQQDARPAVQVVDGFQHLAQQTMHHLGKQMLLMNIEFAACPGFADYPHQSRQSVLDKNTEALLVQHADQGLPQDRRILIAQDAQEVRLETAGRVAESRRLLAFDQFGKYFLRLRDHPRRAHAGVQQALDQTQSGYLVAWIVTFATGIPLRQRKAVPNFPLAQDVLGKTGFAFHRADRQGHGRMVVGIGQGGALLGSESGWTLGWTGSCVVLDKMLDE